MKATAAAAALGALVCATVPAHALLGVYGPKGNDTGGIIPWSPEAEAAAMTIAQDNCGWYRKYAVITSVHRVPGDYIAYRCQWRAPLRAHVRIHRKVSATIGK